jgi:hypothetical protein
MTGIWEFEMVVKGFDSQYGRTVDLGLHWECNAIA